MKRFTETNKWRDPWYRKLSSPAKQLWEYLRDNCDAIGLIELDLALAGSDCGQPIEEQHLAELGDRVQVLGAGKYFLPKFIHFQYGELSHSCPPHKNILKSVAFHKLVRVGLHYAYPSATLSSETVANQENAYPNARVVLPYRTRRGQEEEKEKETGKGSPEGEPTFVTVTNLLEELGFTLYNRAEGEKPSRIEEEFALEIIKRPNWKSEKEQVLVFGRTCKPQDRRFDVPKTLARLLEDWSGTLDKARTYRPHERTPKHNPRNDGIAIGPTDYGEAAKRKLERQTLEARNRQASQVKGT